jgi:hypothetical protein
MLCGRVIRERRENVIFLGGNQFEVAYVCHKSSVSRPT